MPRLQRTRAFSACCAAVVALLLFSEQASCAGLDRVSRKRFVYSAQTAPLNDVLRDFASSQGLPLVLADGLSGTVNSNFNLMPEAFLDAISRAFGLIWYFDGVALYVYPSSQIQTRLFRLKGMSGMAVQAKLAAFGLGDSRFPVRVQPGLDLLLAFGPPRHIELIEGVIAALTEIEADAKPPELRVFQLVHASAVDRVVQGLTLPGVATTLSNIYGVGRADAGPNAARAGVSESAKQVTENLFRLEGTLDQRGQRDASIANISRTLVHGGNKLNGPADPVGSELYRGARPPADSDLAKPSFVADEATNAVLVRGPGSMMADVARLVAKLDVPSELIELEATIIDISSEEAAGLGFDWQYRSSGRSVSISPVGSGQGSAGASNSDGFNITTLLSSGGRELLSRVRAIEARGGARIVSQPKVLGAANRTALLSDKRTASVRVAGNQDARLYSVEAGTTLQVTPRFIADQEHSRIGLDLLIEDGSFLTQLVDQVPIIQRTTIRTDATLLEGQSLLIGGIVIDSNSTGRSGVPFLSRLPLIGALFRSDESSSSRRQRMFLLTPKRVVLVPPQASEPAASAPALDIDARPVPQAPGATDATAVGLP